MEIKRNVIPGTPRTERAFAVGDQIRGTITGRTFVVLDVGKRHTGEPEYRCIQTNDIECNKGKITFEFGPGLALIDPQPSDYIEATPGRVTYTIDVTEVEAKLLFGGVHTMDGLREEELLGRNNTVRFDICRAFRKAGI